MDTRYIYIYNMSYPFAYEPPPLLVELLGHILYVHQDHALLLLVHQLVVCRLDLYR